MSIEQPKYEPGKYKYTELDQVPVVEKPPVKYCVIHGEVTGAININLPDCPEYEGDYCMVCYAKAISESCQKLTSKPIATVCVGVDGTNTIPDPEK